MHHIDLSIVIPVYNEAKTIRQLLESVYYHTIAGITKELLIVESNSTDGSREIVQEFVKDKSGITLVLEERPRGKGHAVRAGLSRAQGDIILIQDADLEYEVNDYAKLIQPIREQRVSFVLGSRHLTDNRKITWGIRKFKGRERAYAYIMNVAGIFIHTFFNLMYGTKITDPTTMYKVFKRDLLKEVNLVSNDFMLDWELVGKFVRRGYTPMEIPVSYHARGPSEGKKIRLFRDGYKGLYNIVRFRLLPIDQL